MAITKKKRVSKKLKESWRKHVNIADVEDFLEDKRLEERLGPPLATISNDELFVVDTISSLELLSRSERRKLRASKPLKCFSALQPLTKVPDPIKKRNRVRTKEERKNDLIKKKDLENKSKGILKAKEIQAAANRKLDELQRRNKPKRGEFSVDIWQEVAEKKFKIEQDEWASNNTKKHNLRGTGVSVKSTRKSVTEKKSPLPTIEPPHPGMSYNPSYEDHQDLLRIVADEEIKLIKEEEHLTRCTRGMFQKVSEEKRDQSWLVEMSEGLPSKEGTNVDENEASDNEYKMINPPVKNVKKTVQQRRKQKEQLKLQHERRALKLEKKKITDIHRLKMLNKEVDKIEKKQHGLREKRKNKAELKKKTD
ncbi:hypothetical protein NQ314_006640 [Rhamnusium bicolor]|uniref:Ribosome biogenesis protein NOP53 n=1 Tax=Rhamnusium bicolor TaxID=1586634 RepID=A0AAV8Z068_9CUCU|nr:hypothetical protein NQ314_006640 [Rhamnusium bicolor]